MVMVDRQFARGLVTEERFLLPRAETEFTRLDVAIVALPNGLDFGERLSVESARYLETKTGPAQLAVGFIRREALGVRIAEARIASGMLGDIRQVSVEDGYILSSRPVNEFPVHRSRGDDIQLGSHL